MTRIRTPVAKTWSVAEAKAGLSALLDAAVAGEEITITRHGKPVARIVPVHSAKMPLPDLAELRAKFPPLRKPAAELVTEMRDDNRY